MKKRRLGNSDLQITAIGFGAWAIGGTGYQYAWGPQDDQASIEAIHRSLDFEVNWIDTAPAYGKGHSEEVVAQALAGWSGTRPYIFTKCGLGWDRDGKIFNELNPQAIRQECEDSLRRLRVDAIDLYQIHWPTGNMTEVEAAWSLLAELKREGKVRWIGVSNFDVQQLQRVGEIAPVTSLQPPYSLVRREIEAEILPYCRQAGIGVIAYSPMYSGLLTGVMTRERIAQLPEDDWRRLDPEFKEPRLVKNLALIDRLKAVGSCHNHLAGEVAVAWTLLHPAVTGSIVGIRSATQAGGILGAAALNLSAEEIKEIEAE